MRKSGNSTNYPGVPRKVNSKKSQKNSLIMAGIMLVVVFLIVGIFYISSKIDEINPLVSNEQTIQEEAPNVTQSVVEDVQTVEDIASHENTLQESSITESPSEIPSETPTDNTTDELISETTKSLKPRHRIW
jgi:uncharacterized protein YybS (DUF2232 family)